MCLSAVEHVLSIISTLSYVWPCHERGGAFLLLEAYFLAKYRKVFAPTVRHFIFLFIPQLIFVFAQTFTTVQYTLPRALVLFALQITTTFIWNFCDLFIILVSMGLGANFRQLNRALEKCKGKVSGGTRGFFAPFHPLMAARLDCVSVFPD